MWFFKRNKVLFRQCHLAARYKKNAQSGVITFDKFQFDLIKAMDRLKVDIEKSNAAPSVADSWQTRWGLSSSSESIVKPNGLYVYGGVGCGKTYLMDMLFDEVCIEKKRRVHFHEWMLEIHKRLHEIKKMKIEEPPIEYLIEQMLQQYWFICIDEFQVRDIADALIIKSIFDTMYKKGAVAVMTSNRHPDELYKNGLQRHLFVPFINLLKKKNEIYSLMESSSDYRMLKAQQQAKDAYLCPMNEKNTDTFNEMFLRLSNGKPGKRHTLQTQGREILIARSVRSQKLAIFSFEELCNKPLGAADYLCIAENYSTVFISNIPKLEMKDLNALRRFITLIDCFYDHHVILYCLADAPIAEIFVPETNVATGVNAQHDEVFAFDRTISRLSEMQSEAYRKDFVKDLEFLKACESNKALQLDDVKTLWTKYDRDNNNLLDEEELQLLLEDICFVKFGHRNVPSMAVQDGFKLFLGKSQGATKGIPFSEFNRVLKSYGFDLPVPLNENSTI